MGYGKLLDKGQDKSWKSPKGDRSVRAQQPAAGVRE